MNPLVQLTLRGSVALLMVIALDRLFAHSTRTFGRRLWWCCVPMAFLLPVHVRVPVPSALATGVIWNGWVAPALNGAADLAASPVGEPAPAPLLLLIWIGGVIAYSAIVLSRTVRVSRQWSKHRFCTDGGLLELLEDAKRSSGVTAPIGLIVSDGVAAPAVLGWLRPRILLPSAMVAEMPPRQLRAVLLHELAHFHAGDIPLNWLFSLAGAVHWFNPLSYLAASLWRRFQEEAADEAALSALEEGERVGYGPALLEVIKRVSSGMLPSGALAMAESMQDLKRRLTLITESGRKAPRFLLSTIVVLLLATVIVADPVPSDGGGKIDATVSAMQAWLKEIDSGAYAQSWTEASDYFRGAISQDGWVAKAGEVRTPLGSCTKRTLLSAARVLKKPDGTPLPAPMIVARFSTSFTNLIGAVETVSFAQTADGSWKAAGYFIKAAGA